MCTTLEVQCGIHVQYGRHICLGHMPVIWNMATSVPGHIVGFIGFL